MRGKIYRRFVTKSAWIKSENCQNFEKNKGGYQFSNDFFVLKDFPYVKNFPALRADLKGGGVYSAIS
jgi:hypothetical protein